MFFLRISPMRTAHCRPGFRTRKFSAATAAISFRNFGPRAVESLIEALGDEDDYARKGAAFALGDLGDGRAVEPLLRAMRDEAQSVRWGRLLGAGEAGKEGGRGPSHKSFKRP